MLATYEDYRRAARARLPRVLFDYVDGGAYAERTLEANAADMAAIRLRQRVMRDVSKLETRTELFGQPLSMPVLLAPVGMAGLYARRGEAQAARAAVKAGIPQILSTLSICGLEEIAPVAPPWFQLYVIRDRPFMLDLIARAKALGSPVLVLTVDLPVPGARYRDMRSGLFGGGGGIRLAMDVASHPGWALDVGLFGQPHGFANVARALGAKARFSDFWVWVRANFDPAMNWDDLAWIREAWGGPIVIKGVLDPDDARRCCDLGVDGLVVSNHGGRQLDDAPSGAAALPSIVAAVEDRIPILMDGGVRSGLDVLKALALGARACLIGRAWAYALAAQGERGVSAMLATMQAELRTAMALTGCIDVKKAGPGLIWRP